MNKTEALVAMLEASREFASLNPDQTALDAGDALSVLVSMWEMEEEPEEEDAVLVRLGGAVLALLATDEEPVAGRSLDEWLADKEKQDA